MGKPAGLLGIINQRNVWVLNPDPKLIGTEVTEHWALERADRHDVAVRDAFSGRPAKRRARPGR